MIILFKYFCNKFLFKKGTKMADFFESPYKNYTF